MTEEGRMQSSESVLRKHFAKEAVMRIAMEAGTHSPWVSRLLKRLGHQVLVANPRKIRAISGSESKNDRNDAEQLARFAAFDPKLLSPIEHRSEQRQQDLNLIHARSTLVRARTMIVNVVRGLVKSAGGRLPSCSTESFAERTRAAIPAVLSEVSMPQMTPQISEVLEKALALSTQDRGLIIDRLIESLDDAPAEEGVEEAWSEEIKRRVEDIKSGRVEMIPGEEVHRRLLTRLSNGKK